MGDMERWFGPDGLLSQAVPGFEHRALQAEMAREVARSLDISVPLLVEAGTGTGKTWAYLVPAIESGKKVLVSTGTKTLQDQVHEKDIPFLKARFFPKLRSVCVKGRGNYLCRRRLSEFLYQPAFHERAEAALFPRLKKWAERTVTGDRAEMAFLPDGYRAWGDISCESAHCLGAACPEAPHCFLSRLREKAEAAQLLVVNHHLYFSDLALRARGGSGVLPEHDAVVFDEAHGLEDVVSEYFGAELTPWFIRDLCSDVEKGAAKAKNAPAAGLHGISDHLRLLSRELHEALPGGPGGQGRFPLARAGEALPEVCGRLHDAFRALAEALASVKEGSPLLDAASRRAVEGAASASEFASASDPDLVHWYEVSRDGWRLHATPVEVSGILDEALFSRLGAVVFTSATLSAGGSFDFIRSRLGIPREAVEVALASPFDYPEQALLYIPRSFPQPQDPAFCPRMAEEALVILAATRGRALFLFTSYRNMREVHGMLAGRLPFPLLLQGERPKRALLSEFREDVASVLLATASFWEGVDVPGEALSCVLIDKLPFDVPDDPLLSARARRIEEEGESAFARYQLPRAVIHLRQGVGRLIRSATDRGVIGIFDTRLLGKSYGRTFLSSLPPARVTHDISDIASFMNG